MKTGNKLTLEKSPYLLQHAKNPVDWLAWNKEAFEEARKNDKPIFLSIGYSTCHWCHVMEHESFEDPTVAAMMNEVFVNIKVDREERPDIDHIYMTVCQMMSGQGGWPLTIFMTPDMKPFFAATYIPKTSRHGHIGMIDLIPRIQDVWTNRREEVYRTAEGITAGLLRLSETPTIEEGFSAKDLHETFDMLSQGYDETYGGFGAAPKFPTPSHFRFLLRYWKRFRSERALNMVTNSLTQMRQGGVFDHVGLGFHRYSTDREWLTPHFEKMLYDQATLLMAYTEAYQATKNPLFEQTAHEICAYVKQKFLSPEGAFYSAEDADSEGEEGKFYLWEQKELQTVLTSEEFSFVKKSFNIQEYGNFVEHGVQKPGNILSLIPVWKEWSPQEQATFKTKWESIRKKLESFREKRIFPHKDDKILTDWNALMIGALAKSARVFNRPDYSEMAQKALQFLNSHLKKKTYLHRYRDGEAAIISPVDDYAFLLHAHIELYESVFDPLLLENALLVAQEMIDLFWDEKDLGFFFTSKNAEALLVRKKERYDGATPAGQSVAIESLSRLSKLTGQMSFDEYAQKALQSSGNEIRRYPSAYTYLMSALDFTFGPPQELVVTAQGLSQELKQHLSIIQREFLPHLSLVLKTKASDPSAASSFTSGMSITESSLYYICENFTCAQPTQDFDSVFKRLCSK
ncbi:MAG: thioredoxin domain-containing protein [Bdellovibrionales bacterium]